MPIKKKLKIAIFFNNVRGVYVSKYLNSNGYSVVNIITRKNLNKQILKHINNYKIINNLKSNQLINTLSKKKFDIFIAAGFPHIFKPNFLKLPKLGILNLHAGKLPKYRGGSPLNWQIINMEKKIGISVILLNEKIDQGDIVAEASFPNTDSLDIFKAHEIANKLFVKLTLKSIKKLEKKSKFKSQNNCNSYYKQRRDIDGLIDCSKNAFEIFNFIKAITHPYKGAFIYYKKKKIRIYKSKLSNKKIKNDYKLFIENKTKKIYLKCNDGYLEILKTNLKKKDFKIIDKI